MRNTVQSERGLLCAFRNYGSDFFDLGVDAQKMVLCHQEMFAEDGI